MTKSMVKGDKNRVKAKVAKHAQHTPKAVKTKDRLAQPRHSEKEPGQGRAS